MISIEKLKILTPLQKLPNDVGDLGKFNCCQRLWKVALSPINHQIGSHCLHYESVVLFRQDISTILHSLARRILANGQASPDATHSSIFDFSFWVFSISEVNLLQLQFLACLADSSCHRFASALSYHIWLGKNCKTFLNVPAYFTTDIVTSVTRFGETSPHRHNELWAFSWVTISYLAKLWPYFGKYFILLSKFHCSKCPNIVTIR